MTILSFLFRKDDFRTSYLTAGAKGICCLFFTVILASLASCSDDSLTFNQIHYQPQHASGFEIVGTEGAESRVLRITQAWQGADSTAMELFIARNGEKVPAGFEGQVIRDSASRIIALSSTHIAMLDLLGKVETVKGVSGIDYISNTYIQENRDKITDVGFDSNVDLEALAACRPDLVLLYGVSSAHALEGRLKSLHIPYLYIGEYLEPDPLGRTEWLVALAEVTGNRAAGERIFQNKVTDYQKLADNIDVIIGTDRPKVMLNTPYGDTWFMPSENSAMVRMIEEAGGEYLCKGNRSNKSEPVDPERAYLMASEADFWLNTGQCSRLSQLAQLCPKFTGIRCFREGRVWNCDKRTNSKGGNDFWESGVCNPELILKDLINIFHPGLLEDRSTYYYQKLK